MSGQRWQARWYNAKRSLHFFLMFSWGRLVQAAAGISLLLGLEILTVFIFIYSP
jgi:hypothetical protein